MDNDPRLLAAQGYLELEMPEDARRELEAVEQSTKEDPDYLVVLLQLLMKEEAWEEALAVSEVVTKKVPEIPIGHIHGAFCLHEMGRTEEAREALAGHQDNLESEPVFHYNMACYLAVLGDHEGAEGYLQQSIKMNAELLDLAKTDPDLQGFWDAL